MQQKPRYPVGMQDFPQVREGGYVYVDKTAYLHRMVNEGGNFYFLSRPRRFGKSLFLSTLQAYFEGRRELFAGLAVEGLEPAPWPSFPVIRLDLSDFKPTSTDELADKFELLFRPLEQQWGSDPIGTDPGSRLELVVRAAYEQTGCPVVVLVDEYDAPLLASLDDPALLGVFRREMRKLYSPIKKLSPMLRFVFLTGVSRFSQVSLFSELNSLNNISLDVEYAGVCGITQEELFGTLRPFVDQLAEARGESYPEAASLLKRMYDGYHFSAGADDVYNPYSLVSALAKNAVRPYWFESGTPTALVDLIRNSGADLEALDRGEVRARASSFNAPVEGMDTVVPFMYQAGYLTIKGYDQEFDTYRLGVPNQEVRQGLFEVLLPAYTGMPDDQGDALVQDLALAVRAGTIERFFQLLAAFFSGMDRRVAVRDERDFEQVLYIVLALLGAYVRCEVSTARGRADIVMEGPDAVYAIELKYARASASKTAEEALAQVLDRGYLAPWRASGKRLVAVGAVFDEVERTVTEWLVEELQG